MRAVSAQRARLMVTQSATPKQSPHPPTTSTLDTPSSLRRARDTLFTRQLYSLINCVSARRARPGGQHRPTIAFGGASTSAKLRRSFVNQTLVRWGGGVGGGDAGDDRRLTVCSDERSAATPAAGA
jgi:hypothetical protein